VPLLVLMFLPNVVNGILLPVILLLMLKLINDRGIMGQWVNSRWQNVIARLTTGLLIALTVIYLSIAILEAMGALTG
jgi:Mn2+/Fe2+ NRAMP family transporter